MLVPDHGRDHLYRRRPYRGLLVTRLLSKRPRAKWLGCSYAPAMRGFAR